MADTITNHISKGVTQITDTSKKALWYQTNFNMPIHDFVSGGTFTRFQGPVTYDGEATSFSLTGFLPGFEICNGAAVFDFDNTASGSPRTVNTTGTIKWTDTSNNLLNGGIYTVSISTTVGAGAWFDYWFGANIGFEPSEIATSTTYDFRSSASGTPNITEVVTAVAFTSVPSITTLNANDQGYIWVEGNDLTYVNADQWKHNIVGTDVSSTPGVPDAGYIWMDSSDGTIHWVGGNGHDFKTPWIAKQFASFYNNSATGAVNAGAGDAGYIWVDNEFGGTHLAIISNDGFKYLTGAGVNPY